MISKQVLEARAPLGGRGQLEFGPCDWPQRHRLQQSVRMAAMGCARTVLMSHHLSVNNGTCSEPDADMTCCRLAELGLLPFGDSCSKLQTRVPRTFKDEFR